MAGKDIQARLTELNENEILLYLGYRGQKYPAEVEAQIKRCEKDVLAAAYPRLIWRRLPVNGVDRLLTRNSVSNMADAVIMDACASTAIENVADNFEMDLRREVEAEGLYLTDRFSPGYGDLPLSAQKKLCAALDTGRRIGLSLSPSLLMIPGKSVTAVLGIADMQKSLRKRGCENCSLFRDCMYRRDGKNCQGVAD